MEKTVRAAVPLNLASSVKSAIDAEAKACVNCRHVHGDESSGQYQCWKAPPTAVAAWVQTRDGSMNLQVGAARAPVLPSEWCGDGFERKTSG